MPSAASDAPFKPPENAKAKTLPAEDSEPVVRCTSFTQWISVTVWSGSRVGCGDGVVCAGQAQGAAVRHALPSVFFCNILRRYAPEIVAKKEKERQLQQPYHACVHPAPAARLPLAHSHMPPSATCRPPQSHSRLQQSTRATRIMAGSTTRRSRTCLLWG